MKATLAVICCLLVGACGGSDDTRLCVGSATFCGDAFGRNRSPEADAGPGQRVAAGETVELDGSDSFDPDGRIASYSWTQRSGDSVALQHADRAFAAFTAPEVATETILEFRLVVTDDDDASDDDRVRITVLPPETAALSAGIELLETVHRPSVPAGGCADCWSYLGLWLAARVQAAATGPDDRLDELLDELRMIEQLHADQSPDLLSPPQRRLFELGQHQVARFTARRDPATAELAARHATSTDGTDLAETWWDALAAAYPRLDWIEDDARRRRHAVTLLLRPHADAPSPETVAAATLTLALPAKGDAQERTAAEATF